MDLQQLYTIESALEVFFNDIYDIKEKLLNKEEVTEKSINLDLFDGLSRLNAQVKKVSQIDEHIKQRKKENSIEELAELISTCCGLTQDELKGYNGRKREYVRPKQVHMAMLNVVYGIKDYKASAIYGLDRVTVVHCRTVVKNLYITERRFREKYQDVFNHCKVYNHQAFKEFFR